jgi:hypothetical protein
MRRLVILCAVAWLVGLIAPAVGVALPEARHYEMVSPLYKGGYGVENSGVSAIAMEGGEEGEALVFRSHGIFAGSPNDALTSSYLAQRAGAGWATTSLAMPATLAPESGLASEFQPAFGSVLFELSYPGENVGQGEFSSKDPVLLVHRLDSPDTAPSAAEPDPLFSAFPNPAPNFEIAGLPLERIDGKRVAHAGSEGTSLNLCTTAVRTGVGGLEGEPLSREAIANLPGNKGQDLYEVGGGAEGCGDQRFVRLVGVGNKVGPSGEPASISAHCPTELGGDVSSGEANRFNAITTDGSGVFFTVSVGDVKELKECNDVSHPAALFARLGGERTIQISKPISEVCEVGEVCPGQQPAEFVGASEAGSKVFFTSVQATLVPENTDTSKNVYLAEIGCPETTPECATAEREVTSLVQLSHDPQAGKASNVQGVVGVSGDGDRVYFVAQSVLSEEGPVGEGVQAGPIEGADNLYVYDSVDRTTHFVADLCSGPSTSGQVEDLACSNSLSANAQHNDTGLWRPGHAEAQIAGAEGRFLLFSAYGRLTSGDTDSARDVYRYDAGSGTLTRVSVGEGEYDVNGNNDAFDASLPLLIQNGQLDNDRMLSYRAVSEDGSRILFETAEPLSPAASNGLTNAYEWHEGEVSLVSSGSDPEPVGEASGGRHGTGEAVITPSGRDIFFVTVQGLLPGDTDGARDVYDARIGEGLVPAPAPREQCPGGACRGPLVAPAPELVPASASQVPGENLTPATAVSSHEKAKPKHKKRRHRKRRKPKHRARARHSSLNGADARRQRR